MIRILYSMNVMLVVSYHARYVSGIASMHDVILHMHPLSSSYSASYCSFKYNTFRAISLAVAIIFVVKSSLLYKPMQIPIDPLQ